MINNNYGFGYHNPGIMMTSHFGVAPFIFIAALVIVVIWSFYWKARALWTAARHGQLAWFIVLLIVNTLGILEIVYLYFFACDCAKDPNAHDKHIHGHAHSHDHTQGQ